MRPTAEQIEAGQALYTQRMLRGYDALIFGVLNPWVWKCPTDKMIEHYNRHVTANHLDVGVGTGYLLDKCRFPVASPRIALMDLNPNSLDYASRRIARYRPEILQRNVLEPIPFDGDRFDSIGLNNLLHCLPGCIESKSEAFDHLSALLNPGGVIFGCTLLHEGVRRGVLARLLMAHSNYRRVICNREDTLSGLKQALERRFDEVSVAVVGCHTLFAARSRAVPT
jgi:ubiquinone/menaquinone biosynthesis C-methylase UbiE